jgi:enediyne biosynthesis protein E4
VSTPTRLQRGWALVVGLVLAWLSGGCTGSNEVSAPRLAQPALGAAPTLFRDVAARAGIPFRQSNGATGKFYFIEITPSGCAFLDYDNDGFLDILLIQPGSSDDPKSKTGNSKSQRPHCALYHNNGNGTFTDVTASSGLDKDLGYVQGVAVGDYDNDGYDDLFLTGYGRNFLFHNDHGTGKFTDVTHKMGLDHVHSTGYATSAAFGDYDNDGRLDLYVCYYCPWTWAIDRPCHDARGRQDYCPPDVYGVETHQLFHNDGNCFTDVSEKAGITKVRGRGLAVAFLDYDGDGKQDIFVANDLTSNMLWHNNGNGTFTNKAAETGCADSEGGGAMAGMGIGIGDYDHSGRESLFVTNFSGQPNMLFRNIGGTFQDVSQLAGIALPHIPFLAFGCEFLDYDADGWPDLICANGHVEVHADTLLEGVTYRERKQLFHNEGNGTFKEIADPGRLGDLATPTVSRGLAVGDFDNDGRLDILVNNQNAAAQLFHNDDRSLHHWISFKTVGVKSNRDGYHTRFVLTAGRVRQTATVRAGSSYLSHSDSRIYFGLGDATQIDRVEIHWPSGVRDVLSKIAMDAIYIVTEGHGITGQQPAMTHPNTGRTRLPTSF